MSDMMGPVGPTPVVGQSTTYYEEDILGWWQYQVKKHQSRRYQCEGLKLYQQSLKYPSLPDEVGTPPPHNLEKTEFV